jgi:Leucine-rich repeat (LRR) protein
MDPDPIFEEILHTDFPILGWLDDLKRFQYLISLNLADNDLKIFPNVICHLPRLVELNLASNGIDLIPNDIDKLQW